MPTEYTPTATYHNTVTCIAAGDYMRPSGIVAGLEDLADNIAHTKQTTDKVLVQQAILTLSELVALTGMVPGDIRMIATPSSVTSEGPLTYRFAAGSRTCYAPWQLSSSGTPSGYWQLIGAQTEDTYSGVARFGPRLQSGDTTPNGRIPEQRLQGHVRHSAQLITTSTTTTVSANSSAYITGTTGNEFDSVQLGDVIEGSVGPLLVRNGPSAMSQCIIEVRGTFDVLGTPQTVSIASVGIDANYSSGGWPVTIPFRVGAPKAGKLGLVVWITASAEDSVQVRVLDTTGRLGTWRVFRGTTV